MRERSEEEINMLVEAMDDISHEFMLEYQSRQSVPAFNWEKYKAIGIALLPKNLVATDVVHQSMDKMLERLIKRDLVVKLNDGYVSVKEATPL